MPVIDEEGRLFGVVNVIDLAVVLVVVATLVAGAAFVLAADPEPPEERYLTVVLDERPGGSVPTLDGGAAMPDGPVQLGRTEGRITDTYVAPTGGSGFVTVARVRVNVSSAVADRTTDRRLVTDERVYLVGQVVGLTAGDASYRGYIHAVGRSDATLPTRVVNATVVTTLPRSVADRVRAGDVQRVAGREAVRVMRVDRQPTADDRIRITASVSVRVLTTGEGPLYGTQHVRPGAELTVAPDGYEFTGTVTEVG